MSLWIWAGILAIVGIAIYLLIQKPSGANPNMSLLANGGKYPNTITPAISYARAGVPDPSFGVTYKTPTGTGSIVKPISSYFRGAP